MVNQVGSTLVICSLVFLLTGLLLKKIENLRPVYGSLKWQLSEICVDFCSTVSLVMLLLLTNQSVFVHMTYISNCHFKLKQTGLRCITLFCSRHVVLLHLGHNPCTGQANRNEAIYRKVPAFFFTQVLHAELRLKMIILSQVKHRLRHFSVISIEKEMVIYHSPTSQT